MKIKNNFFQSRLTVSLFCFFDSKLLKVIKYYPYVQVFGHLAFLFTIKYIYVQTVHWHETKPSNTLLFKDNMCSLDGNGRETPRMENPGSKSFLKTIQQRIARYMFKWPNTINT